MVEIRNINKDIVLRLDDYPEGSLLRHELMGDHYVKLSFSLDYPLRFGIGDNINTDYGLFELLSPYSPQYNPDTCGYDYTMQFDAYYKKWKNRICRYISEHTASETNFKLTSVLSVHLAVIISNIKDIAAKDSSFKYHGIDFTFSIRNLSDEKVGQAKFYHYSDIDVISALNSLAELYDCEWWVTDNIINFGRCDLAGDEVEFNISANVASMERTESKAQYANRLIAFGAARNLPPNYRGYQSADVIQGGIVEKRLMLPLSRCPNGYVQDETVLRESQVVEAVFVDDDVYPRTRCIVKEVYTYDSTVINEDGTQSVQTFYRVTDSSGFTFDTSLILENEKLHILFQTGRLSGMDFECYYDNEDKYYEIIANSEYGRSLPDAVLHPNVGDVFVLYNWDSTKIQDTGIIEAAEQELYEHALSKLERLRIDPNTYTCVMQSDVAYNTSSWYELGQRVRLVNLGYFASERSSRIIGYEIKLDVPFDSPKYIVGEALTYSKSDSLQSQIDAITYNGTTYSGMKSGGGIYVVTSNDSAIPSDSNVLSSKRSYQQFLSKTSEDIAKKLITFLEGVMIGNEGYRIRPNGDAVLGKITSLVYDAVTQQGFGIEKGNNGYKLSIQDVEVWGKAIFNNLELRKLSYVGGNYSFSPAGSKIAYVKWIGSDGSFTRNADDIRTFRCYVASDDGTTATRNMWEVGDQARCQEFDIKEGNHHGTSNRSYWRLVTNRSTDSEVLTDHDGNVIYVGKKFNWVDIDRSDASSQDDDLPQAGDTIVARGHRTDERRQGFIDIKTHGDDAPSIVVYSGVNSYQLNDSNITALLSPKDIRLSAEKLKMLSSNGGMMSFMEMTRNEISLSLRDFGGTNLLHGSSFIGELPPLNSFAQPFACHRAVLGDDDAKKHLGRNYIKIEQSGNSEPLFSGLFHHVNVEPGETYTASVWLMSENNTSIDGTGFTFEVLKMANGERVQPDGLIGYHYTIPKENGVWERAVYTFTVPDDIKEVGVNFWLPRNGQIYVSEPQLERGTIATDWSEHPDDIKTQVVKAGVSLKDGTLNLSGENIIVDNGNETPMAMFKDGKLRTELIDVGKLLAGEIDAEYAVINNLTISGFVRKKAFYVTQENFNEVTIKKTYKGKDAYVIDFMKTGSFVIFNYLPKNGTYIIMPSVTNNYGRFLRLTDIPKLIPFMEMIGQRVMIINNSLNAYDLYISGCLNGYGESIDVNSGAGFDNQNDEFYFYSDRRLLAGSVVGMECDWRATDFYVNGPTNICIYWNFKFWLGQQ